MTSYIYRYIYTYIHNQTESVRQTDPGHDDVLHILQYGVPVLRFIRRTGGQQGTHETRLHIWNYTPVTNVCEIPLDKIHHLLPYKQTDTHTTEKHHHISITYSTNTIWDIKKICKDHKGFCFWTQKETEVAVKFALPLCVYSSASILIRRSVDVCVSLSSQGFYIHAALPTDVKALNVYLQRITAWEKHHLHPFHMSSTENIDHRDARILLQPLNPWASRKQCFYLPYLFIFWGFHKQNIYERKYIITNMRKL